MSVSRFMTPSPLSVSVDTPYKDIVELLLREGVSGLPVVDEDNRVVGMVTEADLVTKEAYPGVRRRVLAVLIDLLAGREHHWVTKATGWRAGDLMTCQVVACHEDDDVRSAARRMLAEGVKRLPVVDRQGMLVGIVSRQDLLRVFDRPDGQIEDEVRRVLHADPNLPEDRHVDCRVEGGIALLTGDVRYGWDVPIVVSRVRSVPGVIDVVDRIHPRQANPHPGHPTVLRG